MAFNINAQVILSGPKNIKAVTNTIKQQLGNINVNVGVNVPKNASQQVKSLQTQMNALNTTTKRLNAQSATTGKQMKNVAQNTKQAANAMQVLGKETALTFKRFAAAGIVTATFFRLTNAISEAVPKALEFERELVKIQQTTGGTINQLNGLRKTADELAKSLGLDANEIISVGRVFAQTGQTLDQVESSLRAVARASLAPSFGEMENTAEGLIAALAQFNISASQSEAVLASINAVSKQFAVESQDIIGAIRRTGGVFAIAATDAEKPVDALNQLIAIFTSVRSTTRESAETIATGLRTIFSRIQRPQTIEFLKSLNINLTDAEGNFVGLFSAFRILSTELDGIIARGDTLALSRIVEELGGIRQVGKLIPAIREFRKAEAAFAVAAEGASQGLGQDVATGLTPLIKTFEQVQARFDSLIRSITESATFEVFASTIAGLANAFLGLAEALVPVLPAITTLATLKIAGGISDFAKGFLGSGKAGGGIAGAGAALGGAVTGGAGAAQAAASNAAATATAANTQALAANTTAVTSISGVIGTVNTTATQLSQTATALNASINRLIPVIQAASARSALGGGLGGLGGRRGGARPPRGFNRGGFVPGSGNSDTVPAMLTPGEFVIKKSAVQAFGAGNLNKINKYQGGTQGRGVPDGTQKATITMSGNLGTIFANPSEKVVSYDKDNLTVKSVARRNAIANIEGLSAFGPEDIIETKFNPSRSITSHFLNQLPEANFTDVVTARVTDIVQDLAKELVNRFEVPQLFDANIEETAKNALKDVDFNALSGHIFEGVTKSATGAALTQPGALFDFVDLDDSIRERINKLFTPDVGGAISILEAKNRVTAEATNKLKDNGSILNKILRSAGQGNPLDVKASIKKFASGGMASGTDTVPALLTPGEFVVNKSSAQAFGYGNLNKINKYADGGIVQEFANGSTGRGVRVAGGGGKSLRVDTKNFVTSLSNTAKATKELGSETIGATSGLSELATSAFQASFAIPGLLASFESFDGTVGGTTAGLLNLATNLVLIGSSIGPAIKAVKGFAVGSKQAVRGFKIQNRLNKTKGGVAIPGRQGFQRRAPLQRLAGQGRGGVGVKAANVVDRGKRAIGAGKELAQSAQKSAIRAGIKGGGKAGGTIVKSIFKGVSRAGAGLPGIIAALLVDPLVDGVESFVFGAKEQLTEGVSGRRGGTATGQGAIGALSGVAKGAATGAAIGSVIPVVGTTVGAIGGAILGGIDGFFSGAAQQIEFDAFDKLIKSVGLATTSLNILANAQELGSGIISNAVNDTDKVFANLDSAFEASLESATAGLSLGGAVLGAVGATAGFAVGGVAGAVAGGAAGAALGDKKTPDFEDQVVALDKALSVISEEFTASVLAANENLQSLAFDEALALDPSALNTLASAGLELENLSDGSKRFTGETDDFVEALKQSGNETGRATALLTAYNQAVRASALNLVKSERDAAAERFKLAKEAGGEGFFFDSDEFKDAKKAQKEAAQLGLVVQKLGDDFATADPSQIEEAIRAVGGISGEAAARIKQLFLEQQALNQENTRRLAAEKALAAAMAETQRQIEALGEGLKKLDSISAGGVARFNAFASNFEADFDRAFGSDAKLTVPENFNPFENIDTASADEIADGLERIKTAIGDTPGGANEGATAGFQELLKSTKDLPFATKSALEDLEREGGPENGKFASPDAAVAAVLAKLEETGSAPTGAARELLEKNLRAAFVSRQGEGGTVALEQDLIKGVVDQVNTAGEQLKETLASVSNSLNEFRAAQLRVAQISIEIAKKQQQAALKTLDIQQRADEFLGTNKGKDPRVVAQANLDARLKATQTNVNAAGVAGVQVETSGTGLLDNLKALEEAAAPLREAVEAGTASDEQIKKLAAVETALGETKQSLDSLADDTTRLAAIQDRLAQIESRKQSAQDQILDLNRRRAEAMASGDFEALEAIEKEIQAPLSALAKVRAGEALNPLEAAELEGGLGLLEGGGFIGPDEARKIRNNLVAGILDDSSFGALFGSGTVNGEPIGEFIKRPESFGGGAAVGEETPEEARLRAEGQAIADEQKAIVAERTAIAEESLAKRREQMVEEMNKARASFEAAGEALKKLRGEANLLVGAAGGQAPAPNPQGGAAVADTGDGTINLIRTTVPAGADPDVTRFNRLAELQDAIVQARQGTAAGIINEQQAQLLAALTNEINALVSNGINANINGNQNINIANLATAGNEFQQITELTTARAFAEKTPELEQQFSQTMTSQLNTA